METIIGGFGIVKVQFVLVEARAFIKPVSSHTRNCCLLVLQVLPRGGSDWPAKSDAEICLVRHCYFAFLLPVLSSFE